MAFLSKIKRIQVRKEYCVKIDLKQVIEIFWGLTGKWIGGPVRACEGVHKGIEGAP